MELSKYQHTPVEGLVLGQRLRRARELLDLNQKEAASLCGIRQRDISEIESGVKKFIPTPYLSFLATHIELSTIFDVRYPVTVRVTEGSIVKSLKDGEARNKVLDGNERLKRQLLPSEQLLQQIQERMKQELKAELLAELKATQKGAGPNKRKREAS